jgi:hypothetical protein
MSAADVAGRKCWCAVLPARPRVIRSRHLVRGPGVTALGRSDLATPGSARLRNHTHGISLLPIAQADCKMQDTSTEAAPTQRQLGAYDCDPTIDLVLPPRSFLAVRPLTDDEIVVCRSFSLQTLTATRQPAAWALAEATARNSEIHHILWVVTWTSPTAGSGSTGAPRRNLVGVRSATGELPSSLGGWAASTTCSQTIRRLPMRDAAPRRAARFRRPSPSLRPSPGRDRAGARRAAGIGGGLGGRKVNQVAVSASQAYPPTDSSSPLSAFSPMNL